MGLPYPTVGGTFSRDRTGIRQLKLPYYVDADDWQSLDSWIPDSLPLNLPIVNRSAEQENDGAWKLWLTLEGAPEGAALEETYELDIASAEDPIETFSRFPALKTKYKGTLDEQNRVIWPMQITDASGAKTRNPLFGVDSFLNPGSIWRVTRGLREFDPSALHALGKIDEPRVGDVAKPPQLSDGRNWIKRSLKATWRGNVWQFSEEWLASGPGGFVPDLYSPTAQ